MNRISPADTRLCSPFPHLHSADFSYPSPSQLDAVLIFSFTTVMLQDRPGRMNTNSSYRLHRELMELKQDIVSRESVRLNTNKGCFSINTNEKLSHCACSIKALPTKQWCLLLSCKFSCSFQAPWVVFATLKSLVLYAIPLPGVIDCRHASMQIGCSPCKISLLLFPPWWVSTPAQLDLAKSYTKSLSCHRIIVKKVEECLQG